MQQTPTSVTHHQPLPFNSYILGHFLRLWVIILLHLWLMTIVKIYFDSLISRAIVKLRQVMCLFNKNDNETRNKNVVTFVSDNVLRLRSFVTFWTSPCQQE